MSVVVTGATGFLGRRLVRKLRIDGLQVCCLVRATSDLEPLQRCVGQELWSGVDIRRIRLTDVAACRRALLGRELVYHLAAGLGGSTSTLFLDSVVSTRGLIEAALEENVRRFVLVSSLGVYGTVALQPWDLLDESTPVEPQPHLRDPYTYSKVMQERVATGAATESGLPLVIVRPGVIFGPGRGALSGRVGIQAGPVLIRMGGRQTLPYVYVDNCAEAVRDAGLVGGIDGECFNIVDDELPTGCQILRSYRRAGHRLPNVWIPRPFIQPLAGVYQWYHGRSNGQVPGIITRYRAAAQWKPLRYSNQKAKSRLGWRSAIPIDEAIRRSLADGS